MTCPYYIRVLVFWNLSCPRISPYHIPMAMSVLPSLGQWTQVGPWGIQLYRLKGSPSILEAQDSLGLNGIG